ncbi:integrase [Yersinia intermedia]|uniref:tyrosine-type recombinase/integrase n=1 Tax=Yersinia intermedia TaxID=631 RepID=UPI0005E24A7A|nr:tyrosine-type recombinase/integrase [Yersinia intermedia]MCB5297341.1 tyrosine-type recombinase/integrase [Yersinia intermedia]MCB5323499.1 tyrosine-type recombinase/integrase [Yersinia intermedia]WET16958.1 tyrosine-type recombinase/integrase [Yersinia intermedia]CNK18793.1 integrase [Yersinia intermedia]CQD77952.1 integrase [Yersinia intermedia]
MGRKRSNPQDNWMPPRTCRGRSAFEFKPKLGGTIRLCGFDASPAQVWAAYEALINDKQNENVFNWLVSRFFLSADFIELAVETQKDYRKYSVKVLSVFGPMPPDTIKPEHIRKYMDKRGIKSRTQANREKAFISRVFRWGYERGMVKMNPCKGVKQFKEISRTRYITNKEYDALYSVSPPVVQVAMELAYLCCARQGDILDLKKGQLIDQGILIQQSKTSVAQIKAWGPRLTAAINQANQLPLNKGMSSIFVIHQQSGARYTRDGFNSRWLKAKAEAKAKYPELEFDFTFHDLKAKGISDLSGSLYDKQAISGHKNAAQTARYDRKIAIVPAVGDQ